MALVAWFPLNGKVYNNTSSLLSSLSSTSAVYSDNSFIWNKCLSGGNITLTANDMSKIFHLTTSISFWIYVPSSATHGGIIIGNESMTPPNSRRFSIFQYPNKNDLHWSWQNDTSSSTYSGGVKSGVLKDNEWTHVVFTQNSLTKEICIYINGKNIHKETNNGITSGISYNYDTTLIHGSSTHLLSDVKIYDHALTQREVSELYNACILHYDFNEAYIEPTTNLAVGKYAVVPTSNVTLGEDNIGKYFIRNNNAGNYSGIYLPRIPIPNGTNRHYTISFELMCPKSEFTLSYDTNDYSNEYSGNDATRELYHILLPTNGSVPKGTWRKYAFDIIYKDNATNVQAAFDICPRINNYNIYYRNIQYEKKDHFTPYTNGIRNCICYDSSGYNNNSTNTKNIALTHNTNIGKYAVKFNNSFIALPQNLKLKENFSFSIWMYMDNWQDLKNSNTAFISCTEGGGWGFGSWTGSNNDKSELYLDVYEEGRGYVSPTGTGYNISDITPGWHMFSGTFDTKNFRIYLDQTLIFTSGSFNKTYKMGYNDNNTIFLGEEAGDGKTESANYNHYYGLMSDFKMYATTLSADDIKKLYRSKATLHENYKLELNSFIENGSSFNNEIQQKYAFLNEKSVFDTVSLVEPATIKLDDNSEWLCIFSHDLRYQNQYYSKLNSESQVCLNKDNRYSLLKYLDSSIFRKDGISSGKYEFILEYPELGFVENDGPYNRWKQSANPITTHADTSRNSSNMGYEAIHISWDQAWGYGMGLSTNSGGAYLDCQAGKDTWYGAIGQYNAWIKDAQNFPCPDWSDKNFVRLWVRIDGTGYKGWFKTYDNGEILVSKIQER